jgi:hypothetical protein
MEEGEAALPAVRLGGSARSFFDLASCSGFFISSDLYWRIAAAGCTPFGAHHRHRHLAGKIRNHPALSPRVGAAGLARRIFAADSRAATAKTSPADLLLNG